MRHLGEGERLRALAGATVQLGRRQLASAISAIVRAVAPQRQDFLMMIPLT
jgi:hypothetical protein